MSERYKAYLLDRYHALLGYAGGLVTIIGMLHLAPIALLLFYPEELDQAWGFLVTGLVLVTVGVYARWRFVPRNAESLDTQESSVIVLLAWLVAIISGAVPFMFNSGLNLWQALFESTSGWTTTGLSVVDVTQASHMILFYRSWIQLAGGAGFAIIALSALAGSVSAGLVMAEGRTDQLAPHVNQSASIVVRIYAGYVFFGIVALRLAGMTWFDAVNHSFTAISTGGFSTRANSIGHWDSAVIEAVILVLMLLGTINFLTAYTVLRGHIREAIQSDELRFMGVLLLGGVALLSGLVTLSLYPSLGKAMRVAVFEVTSAVTTTGFATVDYRTWVDFGWILLIGFMLVGGGSGSTAGGMKQFRVYILLRAIVWEVRQVFMPPHIVNEPTMIWQGNKRNTITDRQVRQITVYIGLYFLAFLAGVTVMVAAGHSLPNSLFEFASALGTVGLSVGITSADLSGGLLMMMSAAMLLGRLEFFAVVVGVIKIVADGRAIWQGEDAD